MGKKPFLVPLKSQILLWSCVTVPFTSTYPIIMWALTTLSQRERQLAYGMVHARTLSFLTARSEELYVLETYTKTVVSALHIPFLRHNCSYYPVPAISCLRWHITLSNRRTSVVECRLDRCDLSNWDNDTNPERFRRTYFIAYKMIGDVTPRA